METYTITISGQTGQQYSCILKKEVDRFTLNSVLGFMMPLNGNPSYILAGDILLQKQWLDGDSEIKTNEFLRNGACMQAIQLVELAKGELKKNSIETE